MLATYFEQYPSHLAAAAAAAGRQRGESDQLGMDAPSPTAARPPSEGGGTYTISEASEEANTAEDISQKNTDGSKLGSNTRISSGEQSPVESKSPQDRSSPLRKFSGSTHGRHSPNCAIRISGKSSPPQRKFGSTQGRTSPLGKLGSPQGARSPSISSTRNTPEGRESFGFSVERETTPPRSYFSFERFLREGSPGSVKEEDEGEEEERLSSATFNLTSATNSSRPTPQRYNRSFSYTPTATHTQSAANRNRTRSTSYSFSFHPHQNPSHNFNRSQGSTHSLTYNPSHSPSHNSLAQSLAQGHIRNGCPVHDPPRTRSSSSSSSARSSAVEAQLIHCGICSQKFNNPKVLPCLHTFCEACLLSYTPEESLTLTCPVCRQQSILPKDGIPGLQNNRWVRGVMEVLSGPPLDSCAVCRTKTATLACQDCHVHICQNCVRAHTKESGSECHSVISLDGLDQDDNPHLLEDITLYCPSHQGQTLRFYCQDCETAICSSCTDIEHCQHSTLRLSEAVHDHRRVLQQLVDKVTMQLPQVKEAICDIGDVSTNLETKRTEAEKKVRTCFTALHDLLDQRQTALINSLNTIVSKKQETLSEQKQELEDWITGVESGCEFVEAALADCPAMELVLVRKQLGERLMEYANVPMPPAPRENSHLQFVEGNIDTLKSALQHVGNIQSNSAVPQQTRVSGEALKQVTVGRQSVVTVVTRDHKGERTESGGSEISVSLSKIIPNEANKSNEDVAQNETNETNGTNGTVSQNGTENQNGHHVSNGDVSKNGAIGSSRSSSRTEEIREPQVVDLNNGTYEVAFRLEEEGSYSLGVRLEGTHVCGSPFCLSATPPDGTEASDTSSQHQVRHVALNRQASRSTQMTRTSKTSRKPLSHRSSCSRRTNPLEDDLILKVGRRGRSRGEFVNPQGICYSTIKDGRLAVADSNNQCIQVFTLSGECKLRFGTRGRTAGQLQRPTGVAAMANGNYAVADYENKCVSIFEPNGRYINRIGHGKLLGPKGLCVAPSGQLIVVDNKASCVCVFQPNGRLLTKFGNRGTDPFQFAGPHFVAVNSKGHIVVTDFHNHCVKVFDTDGEFMFTFGTSGEGNGQFNAPTGIAVDGNDNIIVADWGNSRIQVFDCQGSFLSYVNTLADPLYGPQGLTLSGDGHVVVADSGNHCFKVYKYLQ